MNIIFKELTLHNYKSHRDLKVEFGDTTKISGRNGEGKSSIIDAVTWILYEKDPMGSKMEKKLSPIPKGSKETRATLEFLLNNEEFSLERAKVSGKNEYSIDHAPVTATEFNDFVKQHFPEKLFLSLYNPRYYFSLKQDDQRALMMEHLTPPSSKVVLPELPEEQAKVLEKQKLEKLESINKKNKTDKENAYLRLEGSVETLQKQVDDSDAPDEETAEKLKKEDDNLALKLAEIDDELFELKEKNAAYEKKKVEIDHKSFEITRSKENFMKRKDEEVKKDCPTCKRPLDPDTVKVVQEQKKEELTSMRASHTELMEERVQMNNELKELVFIEAGKLHEQASEVTARKQAIKHQLQNIHSYKKLKNQLITAEKERDDALKSKNESIFILDAIKAYRAKEAELQGKKVQALFKTLSVRLTETTKTTSEIKSVFVIQKDGKDVYTLSVGEYLRAGIEFLDVLSQLANYNTPCAIDNYEGNTEDFSIAAQLITASAIRNQELEVVAG